MLKTFQPERSVIAASTLPRPSPAAHLSMRVDLSPQRAGRGEEKKKWRREIIAAPSPLAGKLSQS
jgi:hypothetical protein